MTIQDTIQIARTIAKPDQNGRPAPVIAIAGLIRKYGIDTARTICIRCSVGFPGSWLTHNFKKAIDLVVN